ncbi:MAG: histidine kinase [Spirochaetes bacterium GWB1_36_13]|nr:MAG: histidine kinase [Spirochaetes bacterium GWB1_36_13]
MAILIVDDSDIVRDVVKQALNLYGYKDTLEARDGVEALEKVKKDSSRIELYVFDVNMPNMDGITLVGEVRKIDRSTPIIMLTTETDKDKMIKAKNFGATGWIIKPFDAPRFIKVVEMFLKKT